MNLIVAGEKIVVKPIIKTTSMGGIILPGTQAENEGEVIAVGNFIPENTGCQDLKVGDIILWNKHAGTPFEFEKKEYLLIRPNDVIGIVKEVVN